MNRLIFVLALGAAAIPAQAVNSIVDPVEIDNAVQRFTGRAPGTPGGAAAPTDRRLRLAPCGADVRLAWRSVRRDTVIVECQVSPGWKLFVPVVPSNAMMGADPAAATAAAVPVIAKGDVVTIEIKGTGFTISQGGQALEAGPVGSWIRIKQAGKSDFLTCQVVRRGVVSMPTL